MLRPISRVSILAVTILYLSAALAAQEDPACLRRVVPVTVVDRDNDPVPSLTVENFRAKVKGQPIQVLAVKPAQPPTRVLILLDSSASMLAPSRVPRAYSHNIGRALVEAASSETPVAFAHFSDRIQGSVAFGKGREAMARELEEVGKLRPAKENRRTAIVDSLLEALSLFEGARTGDSIILISDGSSTRDRSSSAKARQALNAAGVRVFAILIPEILTDPSTHPRRYGSQWVEMPGAADFADLAENSGGRAYKLYPDAMGKYDSLSQTFIHRLLQQATLPYQLEVKLPTVLGKPEKWSLDVLDDRGRESREVEALFPSRLAPCNPPAGSTKQPN